MAAPLASLARRFRFHETVLAATTAGFEARDWEALSGDAGNPPHWILGHIVTSRRYLARKLGAALSAEPWEALFVQGSQPRESSAYPAPALLVADFAATGARLYERLQALDEREAARPFGASFPDGAETLGEGAEFLHFHEAYHLGQLGLARRLTGRPGFA